MGIDSDSGVASGRSRYASSYSRWRRAFSSRVSVPATRPPRTTSSSSATTMLIEQCVEVDCRRWPVVRALLREVEVQSKRLEHAKDMTKFRLWLAGLELV